MPRNILDEKFKLAINTLLKFNEQDIIKENTMEEDTAKKKSKKSIEEYTKSREIVVLSGILLEKFHKLHTEARKFKVYIRLVKGEVIVYEIPSPAHTFVAGYLIRLIGAWSNYLDVGPELDMTVSHNTEYISDVIVEPRQPWQPGQQQLGPGPGRVPQPRMIVEVGRYESIGSLHSLSREYFSTTTQTGLIQVYLSIKIFSHWSDGTAAMNVMLYLPSPQQESIAIIESTRIRNFRITGFLRHGDIVCTNPRMPNYQINIPSNLLFNGFPGGMPQGTPNNLNIDLWEVQQQILYRLMSVAFMLCCYIITDNS
ncbi:hypothetical protein C1645_805572 [Glomus cerebriforme]|uniref:Restriction endonuclease domain-containing protein n=1 Tax=Glomus cerebriforme TaxID=658196 RepID=A0A397SX10_9GLOM|nr:hypothetical protein C1645_805572 [Glomus cerebriforme]